MAHSFPTRRSSDLGADVVVIVAVVDAAQTIAVLSGPDGVLAAARSDLAVVLLATVALDDLARLRALTDAAGVALIDSGVVGGLRARENGLICLVGAQDADRFAGTAGDRYRQRVGEQRWTRQDRKSTRLNSSHAITSRMPSSA